MKYYLQVRSNGIITDAITYPFGNYVEYYSDDPLPIGLTAGWFKFENGVIVEHLELKPNPEADIIAMIADLSIGTDYRLSLIELGL